MKIHVSDNGVASICSRHTDDEIIEALGKAHHVYVNYHEVPKAVRKENAGEKRSDIDITIAEAERIHALNGHHYGEFGGITVGIQSPPHEYHEQKVAVARRGIIGMTDKHFSDYEREMAGRNGHVKRLQSSRVNGESMER